MTFWLVRWTLVQAVQVGALPLGKTLYSHSVSLLSQVYKRIFFSPMLIFASLEHGINKQQMSNIFVFKEEGWTLLCTSDVVL